MKCCGKQSEQVPSAMSAKSSDQFARYPIEFVDARRNKSTPERRALLEQCIVDQNETSVVFDRFNPAWLELQKTKTRTRKAGRSLIGITRSLLGVGLLNASARNERRAICLSCEHYNEKRKSCNACGCIIALKIRSKHEHCPVGKW